MSIEMVLELGKETTTTLLLIAAPMLLTGMTIGVLVVMFQTVTSIRDQTLTFIPKIVGVILALILFMPWMINLLLAFAIKMLSMGQHIT